MSAVSREAWVEQNVNELLQRNPGWTPESARKIVMGRVLQFERSGNAPWLAERPSAVGQPRQAPNALGSAAAEVVAPLVARAENRVANAEALGEDPLALMPFDKGKEGTLKNAKIAIAKLRLDCQYDDFHKKHLIHGHTCIKGGSVSESLDSMALMVRNEISDVFGLDIPRGTVMEALEANCFQRMFDPIRDYLDGLEWDGQARLDRWLVDYCGAEDTEYVRAVGRKVLVAAVRRVRQPGVKFDYMMVMEGPQGAGKSSALRILASGDPNGGENFSDAHILNLRDKEQMELTTGVWIYEVGELTGKHINVEDAKLFLSKTTDAARGAYSHARTDQRRRCVFVATTNNDRYLKDFTGNRRFWPVKVGARIDLDGLQADRDQLWAEAALVEAGLEALVIPEALWDVAAAEVGARMEEDAWADPIASALAQLEEGELSKKPKPKTYELAIDAWGNPEWRVATDWLLTGICYVPKGLRNPQHTRRVAAIMSALGWRDNGSTMRVGGVPCNGYVKPAKPGIL